MLIKTIPSLFTIGNLVLGIISIILVFENKFDKAALLVIIAMLMDGLDGRVARALNVQSEFGKELDSLSDVISFGVAPAFIMYVANLTQINPLLAGAVTAIFPICGALRLARFNVVTSDPGYFVGLPIPAAGGVLATLSLSYNNLQPVYVILGSLLLSYLMISNVKYPNFKKVGFPKKAAIIAPIVIAFAIIFAFLFPEHVPKLILIPLAIYALYGLKKNIRLTLTKRRKQGKLNDDVMHPKHE